MVLVFIVSISGATRMVFCVGFADSSGVCNKAMVCVVHAKLCPLGRFRLGDPVKSGGSCFQ